MALYLRLQWSPEQVFHKLHVYTEKAHCGQLHKDLRSQKPRRKRHQAGRDRRGQIPNRCSISQRPGHVQHRKQVGHWEGDTVIGAAHQQAVVTLVERKSGFAKIVKVPTRSAELVSQAIEDVLKPLRARGKTLTVDIAVGSVAAPRTTTACYASTSPKAVGSTPSPTRN